MDSYPAATVHRKSTREKKKGMPSLDRAFLRILDEFACRSPEG